MAGEKRAAGDKTTNRHEEKTRYGQVCKKGALYKPIV